MAAELVAAVDTETDTKGCSTPAPTDSVAKDVAAPDGTKGTCNPLIGGLMTRRLKDAD